MDRFHFYNLKLTYLNASLILWQHFISLRHHIITHYSNYFVVSAVTLLLPVMTDFYQDLAHDDTLFTHLLLCLVCSGCVQLEMNVARFIYVRLNLISLHWSQSLSLAIYLSLSLLLYLCHSCQVHLLRTAGDEVTITVRYLREVPSFLKLPLGKSSVVLL